VNRIAPAEVIALIPAAGFGTRFPGKGSKEVHLLRHDATHGPVLLIDNLLSHLRDGQVGRVIIITRQEKGDIPKALGDGASRGLAIEYLYTPSTRSSPHTLDAAWSMVRSQVLVLGFPDIVFQAKDAVSRLLRELEDGSVDMALGITPTNTPQRVDVVAVAGNRVRALVIKPEHWMDAAVTWVMAAWKPAFTQFLHEALQAVPADGHQEYFVGDVIRQFIAAGHQVAAVRLGDSPAIDGGTVDGLVALLN
jgi:glucose-1-phosphate thymidylyltransferase